MTPAGRRVFRIVLVRPEIPPNTGNVIRLAANTGAALHLVEPLGFTLEDRQLRRAGLDYHDVADVRRHASWAAFVADVRPSAERTFAFTTRGSRPFAELRFAAGDTFVFGAETAGLDEALLATFAPERRVRLPMRAGQRSLNLSNAVAIVVYEAWRQAGYAGGSTA